MLLIIIGLPASGKTSYFNSNSYLKDNYYFYDDFISNFFNGKLIDKLREDCNKNICITDPRLCDYQLFMKIMNIIEPLINRDNIKIILFQNNKEACIKNSKNRKRNVEITIHIYSEKYDIKNYNNYNNEIIEVYKKDE